MGFTIWLYLVAVSTVYGTSNIIILLQFIVHFLDKKHSNVLSSFRLATVIQMVTFVCQAVDMVISVYPRPNISVCLCVCVYSSFCGLSRRKLVTSSVGAAVAELAS